MANREISVPNTFKDPYDYDEPGELNAARMGIWFETPGIPETPLQALMEAAPGDTPERSREEIQEIREAVADCLAVVSDKDRFIIEAKDIEGLSYRKLAVRLGCSKSQAEREHKEAYTRLGRYLNAHPIIIERFPMLRPTTWDEAADYAVLELCRQANNLWLENNTFEELIQRGKALLSAGWDNVPALNRILQQIGAESLRQMGVHQTKLVVDTLIDRHHKYGPGNILEFEEYGLLIRMSDKVARIRNSDGIDFADEAAIDPYVDLVGYAAIAVMLATDTFKLPLASEVKA